MKLALYPFFHFGSSISSACTRRARWSPSPAKTICRKQTTWCSVGGAILGSTNAPTSGHTAFTGRRGRKLFSVCLFVFLQQICVLGFLCFSHVSTCVGELSSEPPDLNHGFIPQAILFTELGSTASKFTSTNSTCNHTYAEIH